MNTNLTFNLDQMGSYSFIKQALFQRALERGLSESSYYDIRSKAKMDEILTALPKAIGSLRYLPLASHEREERQFHLFDFEDTLILVEVSGTYNYEITGYGKCREKLETLMNALREKMPRMKSETPNIVPVYFWSGYGAVKYRIRQITVPFWKDVEINYTAKTRKDTASLMVLQPPLEDAGRLMLWHGVPGTGKSYGIRALAQAWRGWCDIHYIADPERFFEDADYMLEVILQNADSGECTAPKTKGAPSAKDEDEKAYAGSRWNLLIMEDSDEFLGIDAKTRQGQSMARLLNLTSGFIGQGLNVLVLITTNEPIDKIHKALQREGRCMASIDFGKLEPPEVLEWAKAHKIQITDNGHRTVAELYNLTRKQAQIRPTEKPLGFVGKATSS